MIAFIFPGQGSQRVGMGQALAAAHPIVRDTFAEADAVLGEPLSTLIFEGPLDRLTLTENTQPALLTVSVAIARLLESRGRQPDFYAGHSLGEYSAHVAAGTLSFADALVAVRHRGQYMQEAVPVGTGAMAAILGLDDEVVERICRRILNVWPANYNCPGQVVISGENPAVAEACETAEQEGARRAVKLRVSGAFHSPLVARAADRLRPALDKVKFSEPTAPFMSTVTARIETARRMGPLLVDQLTAPVRFTHAAQALIKEGVQTFVEVGPGNVLSGLVKRIDRNAQTIAVSTPETVDKLEETLSAA